MGNNYKNDYPLKDAERRIEKNRRAACIYGSTAVMLAVIVLVTLLAPVQPGGINNVRIVVSGVATALLATSSLRAIESACLHVEAVAERTAHLTTKV